MLAYGSPDDADNRPLKRDGPHAAIVRLLLPVLLQYNFTVDTLQLRTIHISNRTQPMSAPIKPTPPCLLCSLSRAPEV